MEQHPTSRFVREAMNKAYNKKEYDVIIEDLDTGSRKRVSSEDGSSTPNDQQLGLEIKPQKKKKGVQIVFDAKNINASVIEIKASTPDEFIDTVQTIHRYIESVNDHLCSVYDCLMANEIGDMKHKRETNETTKCIQRGLGHLQQQTLTLLDQYRLDALLPKINTGLLFTPSKESLKIFYNKNNINGVYEAWDQETKNLLENLVIGEIDITTQSVKSDFYNWKRQGYPVPPVLLDVLQTRESNLGLVRSNVDPSIVSIVNSNECTLSHSFKNLRKAYSADAGLDVELVGRTGEPWPFDSTKVKEFFKNKNPGLTIIKINKDGQHGEFVINTGASFTLNQGYAAHLRSRSSLMSMGYQVKTGLIDANFKNNLFIFIAWDAINPISRLVRWTSNDSRTLSDYTTSLGLVPTKQALEADCSLCCNMHYIMFMDQTFIFERERRQQEESYSDDPTYLLNQHSLSDILATNAGIDACIKTADLDVPVGFQVSGCRACECAGEFSLKEGRKVAQLEIHNVVDPHTVTTTETIVIEPVDDVSGTRSYGGFGSSDLCNIMTNI